MRPALSKEIIQRIQPITLSGQQILDVPDAIEPLFPWGGVQRGTSLGVAGDGGWSLAMAILADGLGAEGWVAFVGVPDLGIEAAAAHGVRLDRMLVVETPSLHDWPTVVSSLLESVDVVAIAPQQRVGPRDARRLAARARERSSVLFHLDGGTTWPTAIDLQLEVADVSWSGVGEGHGYLRGRRATVSSVGRRSAARRTSVDVWLPGPDGRLASVEPDAMVVPLRELVGEQV